MHQGVVRDIEREAREKEATAALAAGAAVAQGTVLALGASAGGPLTGAAAVQACESGVCDLAQTRFRDPDTGKVYAPAAVASIPGPARTVHAAGVA
jgi:hypothetical protein